MRRRSFLTLLGGATVWPRAPRAQQPAIPVIGFLHSGSPEASAINVAAFRQGLSETGFVEGRNVAIEFRFAHDESDRLPELAADLVRRRVAVIAAPGSLPGPLAAKAATTTIPIVFSTGADPVQTGLVASFNRPGGNVTGYSSMNSELAAKRLGLLHELRPGATPFALLIDPTNPLTGATTAGLQAAARAIGRQIDVFHASTNREIDIAFASLVQKRTDGLLVNANPLFSSRRVQVATLAVRHLLPAIHQSRAFTEVGGLMSDGASITDEYRQTGVYVGRVLKGEKPADLPVIQPTRFEFVINLQTARTLGLAVPDKLLALADAVIE
jgi:putative tryptophan/tyrosine transport system substrate-binding protein